MDVDEYTNKDGGPGPGVYLTLMDLDLQWRIERVYDSLVAELGDWTVDKYVEKHGRAALLDFEQEPFDSIARLARGLIPDVPSESLGGQSFDYAREDGSSTPRENQSHAERPQAGRTANYFLRAMDSTKRARYDETALYLLQCWDAALQTTDDVFMARSSQELAELAHSLGLKDKAFAWYSRSSDIYYELSDNSYEAGDYDRAQDSATALVDIWNNILSLMTLSGHPRSVLLARRAVAQCWGNLGTIVLRQGDVDKARELLRLSADEYRETVEAARKLGMRQEFLDIFPRIQNIFENLEDREGQAYGLHGLGVKILHEGKPAEARKQFERSLKITEELGDHGGVANNLLYIGIIAFYEDRFDEAHDRFIRCLEASDKGEAQDVFADGLLWLANIAFEKDDLDEGELFLWQGVWGHEQLEPASIADKVYEFAEVAREIGKEDKAQRLEERRHDIHRLMLTTSFFSPS